MCLDIGKDNTLHSGSKAENLAWIVVGLGNNICHVRATGDVIIVTENVDGVLPGTCWGVINICRAVAVVLAVDLGLKKEVTDIY